MSAIVAPAPYASTNLKNGSRGCRPANVAPGTLRAISGMATTSSHNSHQLTARPASAGSSGESWP